MTQPSELTRFWVKFDDLSEERCVRAVDYDALAQRLAECQEVYRSNMKAADDVNDELRAKLAAMEQDKRMMAIDCQSMMEDRDNAVVAERAQRSRADALVGALKACANAIYADDRKRIVEQALEVVAK